MESKHKMLELNRILVVIEPDEEAQPALDRAVQLAKYAESEIELMLADYNPYLEDGYYFDPIQAQKLRYEHGDQQLGILEKMAKPLRDQGLEVGTTTAWGNPPYAEIVNRVRDSKPALVIKSARHHKKIARLLLSNEDWELVRYCPAPLLLVKTEPWATKPLFLAAVDPDHMHDKPASLDARIIDTAQGLAAISGGDVHLFHSAWVPPLAGIYPLAPDAARESTRLLELGEANDVCASNCHWSTENVVQSLPAKAEELGVSAVIMGAVSRSRLDRILIGNTAEKVLDNLKCDVLVVKPTNMPTLSKMLL